MKCTKYLLISVQGNHFTLHGGPDRTKTVPFPVEGEVDSENGIIRFKSTEKDVYSVAVPFDTDFKVGFECTRGYPSDFFAHSIPYAHEVEILIQPHPVAKNMPLAISVQAIPYIQHFFNKLYDFYEKRACNRREAHKMLTDDGDFVFNNCGCNLCEQRFDTICKDTPKDEEPKNEVAPSKSTGPIRRDNKIHICSITNNIAMATLGRGGRAKSKWYLVLYDQSEREITIINKDNLEHTQVSTIRPFDTMPERTISDLTDVLPDSVHIIVLDNISDKMLSVVQKFIVEWYQYKYNRTLSIGDSRVTLTTNVM